MSVFAAPPRASDFGAVVRQRSWEWLTALQRRLGVEALQIVDERGGALLPIDATVDVTALRAPEVVAAIGEALKTKTIESIRHGHWQLTCVGLAAGRARGAVVLGRTVNDLTAVEGRTELEVIGSSLRPAIEAHLGSAVAENGEPAPRVSALFRALSSATVPRSEVTLLRLYANALAIWHDVELRAYVEDVEGNFRLEIALPGMPASDAPPVLDGNEVSIGSELTRVSTHDLEVLGFRATDEAVAARVGVADETMVWLLVLSGGIDAPGEARLSLYTDVLRQALQHVAAASLLTIERSIWRHLVAASDDIQRAAEAVLREVRSAVKAKAAALTITLPGQGPLVRAGEISLLGEPIALRADCLTTTISGDDGVKLALKVRGPDASFFSSRDQRVIEMIGEVLGSWASGMLRRAPTESDRRSASRSFEEVLEQNAAQTAASGASASIVVIRMNEAVLSASGSHKVAAELRTHLRAGESVGVLDVGEIGLLLYDAAPDVARYVVDRLRRVVTTGEGGGPLSAATVGVAHCVPGSSPIGLVRAAREDARSASRRSGSGSRRS